MHYYSIDSEIRKTIHVFLATAALAIPGIFEKVRTVFGLPVGWGFSISFGAIFGCLYYTFDNFAWRWIAPIIRIPLLHGKWKGNGISSYKDKQSGENIRYEMDVTIKQTFSKIEIFAETNDSTSQSTMASICMHRAMPTFRYSFENVPKNMANSELQRHPGLIELRLESNDKMTGDYFSGKHRLKYGELSFTRK